MAREGGELLAYAIDKMRRGEVHIAPGYDGVYGEISLLTPEERRQLPGTERLLECGGAGGDKAPINDACREARTTAEAPAAPGHPLSRDGRPSPAAGLNPAQRFAVTHQGPPLIVQAGPGTGKTRALTHRLAYLLKRRQVPPESILALTFTRQAAWEMADSGAGAVAGLSRPRPSYPGHLPRPGPQTLVPSRDSPVRWLTRKASATLVKEVAKEFRPAPRPAGPPDQSWPSRPSISPDHLHKEDLLPPPQAFRGL